MQEEAPIANARQDHHGLEMRGRRSDEFGYWGEFLMPNLDSL